MKEGADAGPTARNGLTWLKDDQSEGVRERRFDLDREGRLVPGVLWTPSGGDLAGPRPLVLLGHGASGNKGQDYVVSMARRLVRHRGFAAAAIDGPVHGDRRATLPAGRPAGSNAVFLDFAQAWSSDASMTDDMVADYVATLDALQTVEDVGRGAAGWWGLSMGTILGLPFVAADARIQAAVFGCMGLAGPTRDRIERDAPAVKCPALFLLQWDDELFEREAGFGLFAALGSTDKRLHASMGSHGAVPLEEMTASETFLSHYLDA